VYGGSDEIISGSGKSTMGMVDLGSLNYILSNNLFVGTLTDGKLSPFATGNGIAISDIYKQVRTGWGSIGNLEMAFGSGYIDTNTCAVMIKNTNYTDIASFKTAMAGHQLCYELATPTDFNTTPTEINSYKGNNTLWSDGDIGVEYCCDTKLYIEKKLNE
jgi:hypothetical protein